MAVQFNTFDPNKVPTGLIKPIEQHPTLKTKVKKSTGASSAVANQIPKTPLAQDKKLTNQVNVLKKNQRTVNVLKGQAKPAKASAEASKTSAWGSVKTTVSLRTKSLSNQILNLATHREDKYQEINLLADSHIKQASSPQSAPTPLTVNRSLTATPGETKVPDFFKTQQTKPTLIIEVKDKLDKTTVQEELKALHTPSAGAILADPSQTKQRANILAEIVNTEIIFHNQIQEISMGLNFLNSAAVKAKLTNSEKAEVAKLESLGVYLKDNKHIIENMSHRMESILKNNAGNLEQTTNEFAQLFSSQDMADYLTFANNTASFYKAVAGKELVYSNLIDKYGKDNPEILSIGLQGQHIQLISLVQRPLKFDLFLRDILKTVPKEESTQANLLTTAKDFIAVKSNRSNEATTYISQPEIKKFQENLKNVTKSQTFKNLTKLSTQMTNLAQKKTLTSSEKNEMEQFNLISRYLNADTITPDLKTELEKLENFNPTRLDEIRALNQQLKGAQSLKAQATPIDSIIKTGVETVMRLYQESDLDHTLSLFR